MSKIGFLIPEFPIQTHAFFIREREELKKLGVDTVLISTRRPDGQAGLAAHAWAEAAAKETTYLFPLGITTLIHAVLTIILAGPCAWWKSAKAIFGASDMTIAERLKMPVMMMTGAYLKRFCQVQQLDHVHVHSCANAANVAMFARIFNGPTYSLTLHGPMQDYGTNQANKWKYAAYCIVITQDLMDEVNTKLAHITIPPTYLAPMGVNITDFKRSNTYNVAQQGETIKLISCGRLNYVKAHDDLIRVVAKLQEKGIDAELKICGAMDAPSQAVNYDQELISLADELKVKARIHLLGSVSESRVKEELEHAHFFCLASLKEPLGVATMEAMAMEIPAIVTRSPGVSEMVESDIDGVLVEPRSPDEFVAAIINLIEKPELAKAIARQGREKIVLKFHSGVSAKKIAEGLSKVR
ncbi:MAG: glycosyltransferase family 4 protein [Agarilytica sp.]